MSRTAEQIATRVSALLGARVEVRGKATAVMSGSAVRMSAASGKDYFVKWGWGREAHALKSEYRGLKLLGEACSEAVPRVVTALDEDPFILVMSWLEAAPRSATRWDDLARLLARVHTWKAPRYGLDYNNFIGATVQQNSWLDSWPEFFRSYRLQPQRTIAQEQGRWDPSWSDSFDRLLRDLDRLLPADPGAALVHGDLWSGNVLTDTAGNSVLIDPAVYYGHYEVDLAMARLFGGFSDRFFAAYNEAVPPLPDAAQRVEIYNLYHVLNHLNLFGNSYAGRVGQVLGRF